MKIGDVVRLKHGGEHMTVEYIGVSGQFGSDTISAVWFSKEKLCRGTFHKDTLDVIGPDGSVIPEA